MLFDKSSICQSEIAMKEVLKIPERDKVLTQSPALLRALRSFTDLCSMTPFPHGNLLHGGFISFSAIQDNIQELG